MSDLSTVGGLIALIAVVPLSILLPASISFENGIIENFQVILLLGASFLSIRLMLRTSDRAARSFQQFCALMFVLFAARELSWGRVFYPIGFDDDGPEFVAMADYTWRTEAYVFIAVVSLAMLYLLITRVPVRKMLKMPPPIAILLIIAVGTALQYVGEHGILIGKMHGQTLEELSETIVYAMLPILCRYYHNALTRA